MKKILKGIMAASILNSKRINYGSKVYFMLFNIDYKEFVVSLIRGFKVDPTRFLKTFQLRPCPA